MTRGGVTAALEAVGGRVFGVFEWSPYTVDIVTHGATPILAREAVELSKPIHVLIRWHDHWRGPLDDLQRRIDAARGR